MIKGNKMKLMLLGAFNSGEENYLKVKVKDKASITTLVCVKAFLSDLKLNPFFQTDTPEEKSPAYKNEIGRHTFTANDKYAVHIICAEDSVYLVIKCSERERKALMDAALKHFQFMKVKK